MAAVLALRFLQTRRLVETDLKSFGGMRLPPADPINGRPGQSLTEASMPAFIHSLPIPKFNRAHFTHLEPGQEPIEPKLNLPESAMLNESDTNIKIDSVHSRAICDEIGYRLGVALRREAIDLPPFLQSLVARLAELDGNVAPSIVPCLEDMVFGNPSLSPQDDPLAFADFSHQVAS